VSANKKSANETSADKSKLEAAMKGHVVAEGQLVGTYEKGAKGGPQK